MTSHTDRIFLPSRIPLKSRAKYQFVTSLISYLSVLLSKLSEHNCNWFLNCLTTSMQTVGVIALWYWSLADLTVTVMFNKIWLRRKDIYCGALFWAVVDQNITRAGRQVNRPIENPGFIFVINCNKKCPSRPSDVYTNDDVKKILGRCGAVFLIVY